MRSCPKGRRMMISPREGAGVARGYGRKSQEAAESCLPTLPIFLLLFFLQTSSAIHRDLPFGLFSRELVFFSSLNTIICTLHLEACSRSFLDGFLLRKQAAERWLSTYFH